MMMMMMICEIGNFDDFPNIIDTAELCGIFVGLKQPLYVFKKPFHEAVLLLSTSQSLVSVRSGALSIQPELVMCSTYGTPECMSSCCWGTPRFEIGSTSCSTTPCSTRCRNTPNAADSVANVTSPFSSVSSSSSSSSCDQLQTSPTEVAGSCGGESSQDASANVRSCSVTNEPRTSANETARLSDERLQSMHRRSTLCQSPLVTSDSEQLHTRSPS